LKTQWSEAANFHIDRRSSLVQGVASALRRRIVTGDVAAGSRLPSIARLAGMYGVSTPTMHAAINVLAGIGLVRVRHGVGVFAAEPSSQATMLNHSWMHATPAELSLLRGAIETQAASTLAVRIRARPHDDLPSVVRDLPFLATERSAARYGYAEDLLVADLAFHRAIVSAVRGSEMLANVHHSVGLRLLGALLPTAVEHRDESLADAHRALAVAILDGTPLVASRLARTIARRELRFADGWLR
jgi:DNA-binding FadR family transcriptional regulator